MATLGKGRSASFAFFLPWVAADFLISDCFARPANWSVS